MRTTKHRDPERRPRVSLDVEFPFPSHQGWMRGKLRQHGWGVEERLEALRVLEDWVAVLLEHDPGEVGVQGIEVLLDAIDAGDLEKLREAGRMLIEDAAKRGAKVPGVERGVE